MNYLFQFLSHRLIALPSFLPRWVQLIGSSYFRGAHSHAPTCLLVSNCLAPHCLLCWCTQEKEIAVLLWSSRETRLATASSSPLSIACVVCCFLRSTRAPGSHLLSWTRKCWVRFLLAWLPQALVNNNRMGFTSHLEREALWLVSRADWSTSAPRERAWTRQNNVTVSLGSWQLVHWRHYRAITLANRCVNYFHVQTTTKKIWN